MTIIHIFLIIEAVRLISGVSCLTRWKTPCPCWSRRRWSMHRGWLQCLVCILSFSQAGNWSFFYCFSVSYGALPELCSVLRKEALWPELDRLLRDENDVSTGTTYTAAIPEYRVEFIKPEEAAHLERNFSLANGYAVHDAQHPCRYESLYFSYVWIKGGKHLHFL